MVYKALSTSGGGGGGSGTVTSVSVATANGFAGTVANATTTPAITLQTSINAPVLAGNGTALSAATTTGSGSTVVLSASAALTGTPTTPTAAAGVGGTQIASQAYADTSAANAAATANAGDAADYATAVKLPNSPIYNNGASGIGATITTLTTNTALTVDGTTVNLGQEVLVQNEGDAGGLGAAKNGLYTLSTAPALGVAWILTRNLDYDQPSDINYTGAIYIKAGATLAGNSYALISKVTTVGTDALNYTISSPAYTQIVQLTATQTLTNKRITKRVVTAADATSVTPNSDNADITYQANTQSTGTLTINADGGTPTNGQSWAFKIKSTNVQTFSWNSVFAGGTTALPTASTGSSKIDYFTFIYDTVNSKWHFTGQALGF